MPYSPLKFNWCFRETYCFHLYGQRVSQTRNQEEVGSKQRSLAWLALLSWRWRQYFFSETLVDFHQTS
jgi:hypothetical protein